MTTQLVTLYSSDYCGYCYRAKALLQQLGVTAWQEWCVDQNPEYRREMIARTGRKTVPQIFIGDVHVGGCDDLYALHAKDQLQTLLFPPN